MINHIHEDLDTLANEAAHFQNNDDDRFIDTLLDLNGSSAGARPKMLIRIEDELHRIDRESRGSL